MLALTDPLWTKLDDAHRDRDIAALLGMLAKAWDDDAANSLFYDCLCHQGTCYGATYAAVPHLIEIAKPAERRHERLEIAAFLGTVALSGLRPEADDQEDSESVLPNGLPDTLEGWDKKLDVYRGFSRVLGDKAQKILTTAQIDVRDLRKIEGIRRDFFATLPAIRELCERAFLENLEDDVGAPYLLGGVAAADRLLGLAWLLSCGDNGNFQCSSCGWKYTYILFGDRLAFYEDDDLNPVRGSGGAGTRRSQQDFKADVPSRCDGFIEPAADSLPVDPPVQDLFALAMRARSPRPALLLRHFLGSFQCVHCDSRGPMCSP